MNFKPNESIIIAAVVGIITGFVLTIIFQSIGTFLREFQEFKEYKKSLMKVNTKEDGEDGV